MGRQSWISITGLYNYDPTIFNDMYLPEDMDKDVTVGNILLECAELEVLLPDPDVMKQAITFWSRAQAAVWDKLWESTQFEYNPIWNKDGVISQTETRNLKATLDGTDTDKRSAYNASSFQNQEQTIIDHDSTDTGTVKVVRREQGNIGITTTQQMIKEEREVSQFNMYDYIVRSFKERFCIMVY